MGFMPSYVSEVVRSLKSRNWVVPENEAFRSYRNNIMLTELGVNELMNYFNRLRTGLVIAQNDNNFMISIQPDYLQVIHETLQEIKRSRFGHSGV
jgi:hypothetical protein